MIARMPPKKRTMLLEGLTAFREVAAQTEDSGVRDPRTA